MKLRLWMQVERDRLAVSRHLPTLRQFTFGPGRIVLPRPVRSGNGLISYKTIVDVQAHAPSRTLRADTDGIERRGIVGPRDPERIATALRERGLSNAHGCGQD